MNIDEIPKEVDKLLDALDALEDSDLERPQVLEYDKYEIYIIYNSYRDCFGVILFENNPIAVTDLEMWVGTVLYEAIFKIKSLNQ